MSYNKLITEVTEGFRRLKGRCGVRLYSPINPAGIVSEIVKRFLNANPLDTVFIAVDSYYTRKSLLESFERYDIPKDKVNILSADYIKLKYRYVYKFVITIGVNDNMEIINHLYGSTKFMLSIITKNNLDNEFNIAIEKLFPFITTTVGVDKVKEDNIYSPVEEELIPAVISDEDFKHYDEYSEYISTSVAIFGDFSNIEKCKHGDKVNGISSSEYRNSVARHNGWSETLDTSIEFNRRIDDIYNPNSLFERANTVYNIIKQRRDLVSDNNAKLEVIKNIVDDNKDKNILILSKRGDFAAKVTKYLNQEKVICVDYHDAIEDVIDMDEWGFPNIIKSGVNKGKPRILGAQAQSTRNLASFNKGKYKVMSIKGSSNNKLSVMIDMLIITSPLCNGIYDIKRRFYDIDFNSIPNIVKTIYCSNTIEADKVDKLKNTDLHTVVAQKTNNIIFNENIDGIVL